MQRSIIAPAERVTNLRWGMALIVAFAALAASYGAGMMRPAAIPVAVPIVTGLVALGLGTAVDRFGTRVVGAPLMALGAIAVFFDASGFASDGIVAVTIGLGGIILSLLARWFPRAEVPRAAAIVVVAALLGGVAASTSSVFLRGWAGDIGIALMIVACALVLFASRERRDGARGLTYAEQTYITNGGADPATAPPAAAYVAAFRSVSVWLVTFASGALGYASTWRPDAPFDPASVRLVVAAVAYGVALVAARRASPSLTSGFVGAALAFAALVGTLLGASGPGVDAPAALIATGIAIVCIVVVLLHRIETAAPLV